MAKTRSVIILDGHVPFEKIRYELAPMCTPQNEADRLDSGCLLLPPDMNAPSMEATLVTSLIHAPQGQGYVETVRMHARHDMRGTTPETLMHTLSHQSPPPQFEHLLRRFGGFIINDAAPFRVRVDAGSLENVDQSALTDAIEFRVRMAVIGEAAAAGVVVDAEALDKAVEALLTVLPEVIAPQNHLAPTP